MDLQTRKIEFIKDFLTLQSKETISRFEKLLKKEKKATNDKDFEPMTTEALNKRISKSEKDFKEDRSKQTAELLTKYE